MRFFSQLGLLLWKNLLLQKRKVCISILEVLLPVGFACMVLAVRYYYKPKEFKANTFDRVQFGRPWAYEYGIGFTPDTPLTRRLMENLLADLMDSPGKTILVMGFKNEEKMLEFNLDHPDEMLFGIVFKNLGDRSSLPTTVNYFIRPKSNYPSVLWDTSNTYDQFSGDLRPSATFSDYYYTGFLYLQSKVAEILIQEWSGNNHSFEMHMNPMPYPLYIEDFMTNFLQSQLPLLLIFSFIISVFQNTKNIVYEKELKLKESMKLMGLMPAAHWTSWFITCYVYLAVAMAIFALLFGLNIFPATGPVLTYTDPSLFYVFLLCYAAAIVSYCFMISTLVQRASYAAALSGFIFLFSYFPYYYFKRRYVTMPAWQKLAACLLFNQAMAFGTKVISLREGIAEGARWNNLHTTASADDNFTLLDSIKMLLIDTVIHLLVTWYLDNIWPGEFGVPKPFYFCFMKSYWFSSRVTDIQTHETGKDRDAKYFERDPVGMRSGIRICSLRKVFGRMNVAVDNMSLNMYEGQITVLLGHNGAGKTTTMSMLTGFIPPTGGTAYVDDKDIRTDIDNVRKSLGLCPQHNILFDTLTVEEHLIFFAKLKGCPPDRVNQEVDTMVRDVGLAEKRKAFTMTLSGGQKRKLSVAIALISGSKIVVLDEPSSGMDPASRRQMWDVLQHNRTGRTMLLTTHFMDEADMLGDRIAIMAEGVVKCCGTSIFLKKLYGTGYHLVIVKSPNCNVSRIAQVIKNVIPTAQLESEINTEVSFLLPDDQSMLFADLLRNLENQKGELGIVNFGASATTMEEVFLKVGESAVTEEDTLASTQHGIIENSSNRVGQSPVPAMCVIAGGAAFTRDYSKLTGLSLQLSRLRGVLVKKAIYFRRTWIWSLLQMTAAVFFTAVGLVLARIVPPVDESFRLVPNTPLAFNLDPFGESIIYFSNGSSPDRLTNTLANLYAKQFSSNDELRTVKVDLSKQSMNDYLIAKGKELSLHTYNRRVIVGAEFDGNDGDISITSWYNIQPSHSEPIALAFVLNALAKYFVNSSVNIQSGIEPFPESRKASKQYNLETGISVGFVVALCVSIGMSAFTSSFIYFLIKEKMGGAKHMQVVSGVGPVVFWAGNVIWDYMNYFLLSLLLLMVFAAIGTEAHKGDGRLGLVMLLLVVFGWAILPFTYLAHFYFTSAPNGFTLFLVLGVFGVITSVAVLLMSVFKEFRMLGEQLNSIVLVIFPNHGFAKSIIDIQLNYLTRDFCVNSFNNTLCFRQQHPCCKGVGKGCGKNNSICFDFTENYLDWEKPGIGRNLVFMMIQGMVFFILTLLLENRVPQRLFQSFFVKSDYIKDKVTTNTEDDDVAAERQRINASPASVLSQRDSLLLVNMFKQYGNFVAVDHTCVGVREQECFGLLGQNGAGKTTTFKMLTGDVPVTGGNAYFKGYDVRNHLSLVHANMGYCPQFDALIDQMTGRETLTMYARLRGVPEPYIPECVNSLIDVLLLRPHVDKLTRDYSGGNKRKLSTAMSLIGNQPFVLLDEPSSGVDPVARRQLWNVLSKVRASGGTLVLTSHSMEECEALCTRIAIMVNGHFVCLGSTQHLKSKFGQGYTVEATMKELESGDIALIQPLENYIKQRFSSARVLESYQGYVHMQIPDPSVRLADIFDVMEGIKRELHVQDYHVHQTTLEQVFLAFSHIQAKPKDEGSDSCFKRMRCPCV